MKRGLVFTVALLTAAGAVTPTLACSFTRPSPAERRAIDARILSESDLIFLARVIGYGPSDPDDGETTIVFYEPMRMVSDGELPMSLTQAFGPCSDSFIPAIGETLVILMREADLSDANRSGAAGLTSTVLGSYSITSIPQPDLRRRVNRALERPDIE